MRVLKGNPTKKPLPENEPIFEEKMPSCPGHLDKVGKKEWKRILKLLKSAGVVTAADTATVAAYCECYSRWIDASTRLSTTGLVVRTPNGFPVQSPYLNIVNRALDQMKAFAVELGITPSSRTKVSTVGGDKKEDPLDALMRKRSAAKRG
jgi:P27 family predicted phage terminase small subunit